MTHELLDAVALADRLVVLEHGRVAQVGHGRARSPAQPRSRYVADLVGRQPACAASARDTRSRSTSGGTVVTADPVAGDVYVAIQPHSVSLHRSRPEGSPRNVWSGRVAGTDLLGDRVRIHVDGAVPLVAEVTAAAVAELGLHDGVDVWAAVKATDVDGLRGLTPAPTVSGRAGAGRRPTTGSTPSRARRARAATPARGRCRRRGRAAPTGAIGCSDGWPVCTTMTRVELRWSWISCTSSSSRLSTTTAAGVSAALGDDPVRRAERLGEGRQPAGGRGGEQHQLGRRLGRRPGRGRGRRPGSGGSGGSERVGGGGGSAEGGRGARSWGPRFGGGFRCAPSPCARSVKPRCGPRENSSRTRTRQERNFWMGSCARHGRARGTAEHLVAQVPAVEELQELLVVGAGVGEHELLERGVALLPGRRAVGRGTPAGRRGRPRCTRRRSRRSAGGGARGGTRCAAGDARTRRRGRGCAASARGARGRRATGESRGSGISTVSSSSTPRISASPSIAKRLVSLAHCMFVM